MLLQTARLRLELGTTTLSLETAGGFNVIAFIRSTLAGDAGEVRWQRRPSEPTRGFNLMRLRAA